MFLRGVCDIDTLMPYYTCGGQRMTYQFILSLSHWGPELNSGHRALRKVSLLAKSSHLPLKLFLNNKKNHSIRTAKD